MSEQEQIEEQKHMSMKSLTQAANEGGKRSLAFWKALREEGKGTFERGIEQIRETRGTIIELIKFDLILASFFISIFQFGDISTPQGENFIVAVPFAPLFLSMIVFLYGYFTLGPHNLGPSSGNAHQALSDGYDEREYCQTMALLYHRWSGNNIDIHHDAVTYTAMGIGLAFASIGALAITLIYIQIA